MKYKKIIITTFSIILVITISLAVYYSYKKLQIRNAVKIVELYTDEIEVYGNLKLNDLIKTINGKVMDNFRIDTTKLGKQEINFNYITDANIKVPYTVTINIVDKTPPIISQISNYRVTKGEDKDIEKTLFCGDNYDPNPKCKIIGEYNLNEVGKYPVTFEGTDSSNNKSVFNFTIDVREKSTTKTQEKQEIKTTDYNEIIKKYKNDKTKIGIDVSHWQGDIDFSKLKEAGVEFAYIRVGRGSGIGGKYVLDDKFTQNIKGFNKVGIPVGVYFYSYANSKKDAFEEAKWIIKQVKDYKIDLEIVFDWENWSSFQEFDLSFYKLTELSQTFSKALVKEGYKSMLYSSKNYLENIWLKTDIPVWLAHYTDQTDYKEPYKVWQLCDNGKVSGIDDNLVDIDIMYK